MLQGDGTRSDTYADMRRRLAGPDHRGRAVHGLVPRRDAGRAAQPAVDRPRLRASVQRHSRLREGAGGVGARDVPLARRGDSVVEPRLRRARRVSGRRPAARRRRDRRVHQARLHARADGDLARRRDRVPVRPRGLGRADGGGVVVRRRPAADVGAGDADRGPGGRLRRGLPGGRTRVERSRRGVPAGHDRSGASDSRLRRISIPFPVPPGEQTDFLLAASRDPTGITRNEHPALGLRRDPTGRLRVAQPPAELPAGTPRPPTGMVPASEPGVHREHTGILHAAHPQTRPPAVATRDSTATMRAAPPAKQPLLAVRRDQTGAMRRHSPTQPFGTASRESTGTMRTVRPPTQPLVAPASGSAFREPTGTMRAAAPGPIRRWSRRGPRAGRCRRSPSTCATGCATSRSPPR